MKKDEGEAMTMRRTRLPLLSFALVCLLAASGYSQEQPESPPYQEGEYWQFKYRSWGWMPLTYDSRRLIDGVYEVVYSQKQFKTFYLGPDGKEELSPPNPKIMYLLDPGRDIQFPLAPGKTWSYDYKQLVHMGQGIGTFIQFRFRTVTLTVGAMQKVKTEAGIVDAFRVVKVDRINTASSGPTTTYFFSPQTRSVVRMGGAELTDTQAPPGRIEILLVKHGVAAGALNLANDPQAEPTAKTVSKLQPQGKIDNPVEVKNPSVKTESRPSQ